MKNNHLLIGFILMTVGILSACVGANDAVSDEENSVADYASLLAYFEDEGVAVEETGQVTQEFTLVDGKTITVNGGDVQVFEYSDNDAAKDEVSSILEFMQTAMIMWIAPPHFYNVDKLILIYVGDDTEIIRLMENFAGPQFAGQ